MQKLKETLCHYIIIKETVATQYAIEREKKRERENPFNMENLNALKKY